MQLQTYLAVKAMVNLMRVLYTECVLAERLVRAKVDVAEERLCSLEEILILYLYGSHHPWRSLVLALRHCGRQLHHCVALRDNLKGNLNITIGADSAMLIITRSASSMRITLRAVANHAANASEDACTGYDNDDKFAKILVGISDAHA